MLVQKLCGGQVRLERVNGQDRGRWDAVGDHGGYKATASAGASSSREAWARLVSGRAAMSRAMAWPGHGRVASPRWVLQAATVAHRVDPLRRGAEYVAAIQSGQPAKSWGVCNARRAVELAELRGTVTCLHTGLRAEVILTFSAGPSRIVRARQAGLRCHRSPPRCLAALHSPTG